MEVLTCNPDFYQNNIDKYLKNKKRWQFMEKLSKIFQYFLMLSVFAFYAFLSAYIFIKFMEREYNFMLHMMQSAIIFGIINIILLTLTEWHRFELNTRDKIWYSYSQAKELGYNPDSLSIWEEADKIHVNIIFINSEQDKKEAYFRMDEFIITFEDVQTPKINLDKYQIIMPKYKEGKMLHGILTDD